MILARVDLPDPVGPIIMVLCRPAASISAFRLAVYSPFIFRKVFSLVYNSVFNVRFAQLFD